ncbi:MAG: cation:proton antiporter [Verrucomicrobiota bacterium]|jgi:CPA2 family monovalent cation:H+ antiporter-2
MQNSDGLLFNLAVCLAAALISGWLAARFRFSPIVGYLVAGILCGPFTMGFVVDPKMAEEMADIGVVLLMFGVGLNFNLQELSAVRRVAIPGAIVQSLATTVAVAAASRLMGLGWLQGVLVGLAFSVASTAVLARMLTDHHQLTKPGGHLAMGWTVVEDVFTVVVLVVLPMLAVPQGEGSGSALAKELGLALGKVGLLVVLVAVLGMRFVPRLFGALAGSREMFNLAVPVVALGIAWISAEFFHVSLALGSFLAGVVAGQSGMVERIENTLGPLRDPFAALFFLSIGTLLNPHYVITHPLGLLFAVAVIVLVKPAIVLVLMKVLRQPLHTTLVVAIGLAQIGEFSFILIHQANLLKLVPDDSGHLLVSAAIVSIMLNPFLFANLSRIEAQLSKWRWLRDPERSLTRRMIAA